MNEGTTTRTGTIWYDCTKSAKARHRSGLQRVSQKLLAELAEAAVPTSGVEWAQRAKVEDWFLTAEVFAPNERPGFAEVMANRPCRMAAIFHDAIPLKHPHITWPASVARHPAYMKLLASFDLVLAISEASRRELLDYWAWLGLSRVPCVEAVQLGSNLGSGPLHSEGRLLAARPSSHPEQGPVLLICVGIIEPRKNQAFLLNVCEGLWAAGADFELHVVGRVNPHFGKPIVEQMKRAARRNRGRVHYHQHLSDEELAGLYGRASVTVFPTIAEGCGLPVLESLWRGVPCLCSELPSIRENAVDGGTLLLPPNDGEAWANAIREVTTSDSALLQRLRSEAAARSLPTWADTAKQVLSHLR